MNSEVKTPPVFVRQVFHVTRDGITEQREVVIRLTDDMRFAMNVPDYVSNAINCDPEVYGDSANDVLNKYEELCDDYARWKLGSESKPMLRLRLAFAAHARAPRVHGVSALVGMGITPVWFVDKKDAGKFLFERESESLGYWIELDPTTDVLLPDTPEIREKAELLINSITTAAATLAEIKQTDDPAAYLMAIKTDLSKPEPAQAELPFDVEDNEL